MNDEQDINAFDAVIMVGLIPVLMIYSVIVWALELVWPRGRA
jgi:hypothetical protein